MLTLEELGYNHARLGKPPQQSNLPYLRGYRLGVRDKPIFDPLWEFFKAQFRTGAIDRVSLSKTSRTFRS